MNLLEVADAEFGGPEASRNDRDMDNFSDLEQQWLKPKIPEFSIGDTVDVKVKIREGGKERIQVFQGTVISRRGRGPAESIIVRRIVQGEGVERVFPLHAPTIDDITVVRRGDVNRAKLYYLRDRVGRATRVKEKLDTKGGRKA